MKKIIFIMCYLLGNLLSVDAQTSSKTVITKTPVQPFETGFFVKNVDSLKHERALIDSLMKNAVSRRNLAVKAYDQLPSVVKWFNAHTANSNRADSFNTFIVFVDGRVHDANLVITTINTHMHIMNSLLKRVTSRLQGVADEHSRITHKVLIDWTTYEKVQNDFVNWYNVKAEENSAVADELKSTKDALNTSIEDFKAKKNKIP